jgi:hypothetical protein
MVGPGGTVTGRDHRTSPAAPSRCSSPSNERASTNGALSVAGDHVEDDGRTSFQMAHQKLRDKVPCPGHEHDL